LHGSIFVYEDHIIKGKKEIHPLGSATLLEANKKNYDLNITINTKSLQNTLNLLKYIIIVTPIGLPPFIPFQLIKHRE